MARIAFIGLGNMGRPMAANLVKAGHTVRGFDISTDNVAAAAEAGIGRADTLGDALDGAEAVITMLPAGPQVAAVYDQILGGLKTPALLIDCSTIDVETARATAARAADAGYEMMDAPVSGGVMGAEAATLAFMVGGPEDGFDCAKPILECMGKTVVHCGAAGTGQAAKVCNNMLLGISMIGVCEAFALADKLGLDRQKLFDVSSKASGQCWSLTTYCPVPGPVPTSPANREYMPGFAAAMMLKDLRLAQEAAGRAGAATPLGAEASALYALFCNAGNGDRDFSAIFKMINGE